jgi:hypothetical protein
MGTIRAAGVCVLVVSALTVVSLSVARAVERRPEIVVRRAVGASRRALAGAAVAEGVAIAGAALVAGGVATVLTTTALSRAWPETMQIVGAGLPWVMIGLSGAVILGALLLVGFARPRMPGSDAGARGVPLLVPAAQFAVALVGVLAGMRLARLTPEPAAIASGGGNGVVLPLTFGEAGHDAPALDATLRRLRSDSTITLVSLSSPGTLIGLGQVDVVTTECGRCYQGGIATPLRVVQATNHLASADTFRALNLRALAGRGLTDADGWGAARVAVVNRYLAERAFEGGRAVGRQVRVGGPDDWYRVVGIVEDGRWDAIGAGATPRARVYLSVWQHAARELELLVRSRDGAGGGSSRAAGALGPTAAVGRLTAEQDRRAREAGAARWFGGVLTYQGWGALVLALIGMIAVMRLWIRGVQPDLAVRRMVGARRRHVLGRVGVRALAVVGGGAALTWWLEPVAVAGLARAVTDLPAVSLSFVAGPVVLLVVATLAAVAGPAWRTARAAPASLPAVGDL